MKYFIYDTETTGFTRSDEVIQFAGLLTDDKLQLKRAVSFYCYTQVPIAKKAAAVNGLSAELLHELSGCKTFEDQFFDSTIHEEKDLTWVSYSSSGFDERLINQTLTNNGRKAYNFGSPLHYFDSAATGIHYLNAMKCLQTRCYGGHAQKLNQIVASIPHADEEIKEFYNKHLTALAARSGYHDALYDSLALWWVLQHNKSRLGINEL